MHLDGGVAVMVQTGINVLDAGTAGTADTGCCAPTAVGVLKVASGQVDPHSQQLLLSCDVGWTVCFSTCLTGALVLPAARVRFL